MFKNLVAFKTLYILVKQYQVCRGVFYRVGGTGSHGHVRNGAPVVRASYSCL